jgi:hypothetical protein
MNKTPLIIAGVAVLVAAGIIYAKQSANKPVDVNAPAGKATATSTSSRIVVPQGTAFSVTLQTGLSTKTTQAGDHFDAVMASPVSVDGRIVIPAGAGVSGHVILAEQPGKASGRGHLQLQYDQVTVGGHPYDLNTKSQVYESASGTAKDVALIGGGAVAGGVVGGVAGTGHTAEGAAIGAAAGTGASLMTRGPQLTIAQGTVLNASLDQAVSVRR